MNSDGFALLQRTIAALEGALAPPMPFDNGYAGVMGVSELTRALSGQPAETPAEIAKLIDALKYLPSSVRRGHGSFFTPSGEPEPDYWLAGVWAIASLRWTCGEDIARQWSKECPELYTEEGFEITSLSCLSTSSGVAIQTLCCDPSIITPIIESSALYFL